MPDDSAKYGQSQAVPPSELLQQVLAYRLTLASIANSDCCGKCRAAALSARTFLYPDAAAPDPKITPEITVCDEDHPIVATTALTFRKETRPRSAALSLELTSDGFVVVGVDEGVDEGFEAYSAGGGTVAVPYAAFEELFNRFIVEVLAARWDDKREEDPMALTHWSEVGQ